MTTPESNPTPAPAVTTPETADDRQGPPDIPPGGGSIHVPGQAPGQHVLSGPASMTVGSRSGRSKSRKRS